MTIQTGAGGSDSKQYLSLREAAQLYGYTRDHLGLMIRRGRLEGVRLGTYYATTAAWMDEYIKNYSDADNPKAKTKFSNKFRSGILDKKPLPDAAIPNIADVSKKSRESKEAGKQKTSGLEELQQHIDEVLAQMTPQIASASAEKLLAPPLASTAPAAGLAQASGGHEIIILPVRKMHDFERQIIISQAKQQKKTM